MDPSLRPWILGVSIAVAFIDAARKATKWIKDGKVEYTSQVGWSKEKHVVLRAEQPIKFWTNIIAAGLIAAVFSFIFVMIFLALERARG